MSKPLALIIEDDLDLSMLFTTIVKSTGFETEPIVDGQTALDRVTHVVPSLIVLDLHLPHVSGADILKHVRADSRLIKTKVIVITADMYLAQKVSPDADFILYKPISASQLRSLTRRLYRKLKYV